VAAAGDCPQCGKGGIAPSAWDGRSLYVAAGNTMIGGTIYKGSVRGFNPNNLPAPIWQAKMRSGPVLGAVAAVPGVAFVGSGHYIFAIRLSDGATLFRQAVSSIGKAQSAVFYGAPAVAQGVIYEGDTNGVLYALSPNGA
jgi:outer membrane protein assembly factor BamB